MLRRQQAGFAAAGALAAVLTACAGPAQSGQAVPLGPAPSSVPSTTVTTTPDPTPTTVPPTTVPTTVPPMTTTARTAPTGRVVVLDPGHNGGNGSHPAEINKAVPAGRGKTKPCNTTGTATGAGYPEHAFTWDLALRVREKLVAAGVTVVMTRTDDSGVGPCVDRRAAIGNESGAVAVVSLHADGSTAAGAHGFHVAYSSPPLNAAQGEPSLRLSRTLRDAMVGGGFATSTYVGSDGLSPREDLAGLNLSTLPTALVECGNMRDQAEAAVLSSPAGRARYADAVVNGILRFLG